MIDDLINNQGELALLIETDQDGNLMISGYVKPTGFRSLNKMNYERCMLLPAQRCMARIQRCVGLYPCIFGVLRDIKDMRKQRKGADETARTA